MDRVRRVNYIIDEICSDSGCKCHIEQNDNGDYVPYSDYKAQLDLANAKADSFLKLSQGLEKQLDQAREELEKEKNHPKRCVCGHYHCPICGNQTVIDKDFEAELVTLRTELAEATEILNHVNLQFPLEDYGLDVLEDVRGFLKKEGKHVGTRLAEAEKALEPIKEVYAQIEGAFSPPYNLWQGYEYVMWTAIKRAVEGK